MYVYRLVLLYCVGSAVCLTEGSRRMKREACQNGTYQLQGKNCCLCIMGYRVIADCTDKYQTKCDLCEDNTYMDHPNKEKHCHPCKICDSAVNMEVKENCSKYSDTICRCMKDYFCESGDDCKMCRPCNKCEKHGVKVQCTETKDAVCYDSSVPAGAIAGVLLTFILVGVAACVIVFLKRKQKFCFKDRQSEKPRPEELDILTDVDLTPYLSEISEVMSWRLAKRFALRCGMTKANVDNFEMKDDVKERTYELLNAWHEKQGLNGAYPALIKTLVEMNEKRTADEIRRIVATAQP